MVLQLESSNGLKKMQQICFTQLSPFSRVRGSAAPRSTRSTDSGAGHACVAVCVCATLATLWKNNCNFLPEPVSDHAASVVARERHMPMLARCACNMSLRTAGGTRASRMGFGDDSVRT